MNLEGFGKRGMELGDDPEGIKETKNPLHEEYLSLIGLLVNEKRYGGALFDSMFEYALNKLHSLGLNITSEKLMDEVNKEFNRTMSMEDLEKLLEDIGDFSEDMLHDEDYSQADNQQKEDLNTILNDNQNTRNVYQSMPVEKDLSDLLSEAFEDSGKGHHR